jgi:hypothetical protein
MLNDYRHMMFDYFIKRARRNYIKRKDRIKKIKDVKDAEEYKREVKEKIKKIIGITGNSGGGTLTTWLWAIEERLTVAAPSCFVTPFLYNIENEIPQDNEQYPPGLLGEGLELADFFYISCSRPFNNFGTEI